MIPHIHTLSVYDRRMCNIKSGHVTLDHITCPSSFVSPFICDTCHHRHSPFYPLQPITV